MIYKCDNMRPTEAENNFAAAQIFADRLARREYGRRGYCRTLRPDHWRRDYRSVTYQAFIGRDLPGERGTTTGQDIWFTVHGEVGVISRILQFS